MSRPAAPSTRSADVPSDVRRGVRPILVLLQLYQRWISPAFGPRCRFYPSCSTYAAEALAAHGLVHGTRRALWRVLRCQPFCAGGFDPVPPPSSGRPRPSAVSFPPTGVSP